ncbi:C-type lectin-like EEV membrane phosphoglycoprotein [Eptesipox virus]|uniref:Protein OPG161 n=1 Tax=Eptesipox virus TaxID=1329402 RepID=A0A220T6I5_9POXV|nr:C-type lectin-like EEV membrane phosphoglycoprotein [Eptesipox virus]ASK51331.1 C-type lectin-like EEV membrane phosphoglycoprotein [Eptesipox virus]WAH71089.1 C-type lectin-like EEV membrane phosphoglycoprotein [Eptesipox virus]
MASTNIEMFEEETPQNAASTFTGNTIYASKLKKQKSSRHRQIGICLRVAVVISIVTLMGTSIALGLEVMKLKAVEQTCTTSSTAALIKKDDGTYETHCNGLVYDGDCYVKHADKKSFNDANNECTKTKSQLPQTSVSSVTWLRPHLVNTWNEEGTAFTNDYDKFIDDSESEREYFCVTHLYTQSNVD